MSFLAIVHLADVAHIPLRAICLTIPLLHGAAGQNGSAVSQGGFLLTHYAVETFLVGHGVFTMQNGLDGRGGRSLSSCISFRLRALTFGVVGPAFELIGALIGFFLLIWKRGGRNEIGLG